MEDNKLLRLLHKDPNAGMEQLMNQYTGLVYAVVKSKLDDTRFDLDTVFIEILHGVHLFLYIVCVKD